MISRNVEEYKLCWIGNEKGLGEVGIFLTKKWAGKVIDMSRISNRVIVIKLLVQGLLFQRSQFIFHSIV